MELRQNDYRQKLGRGEILPFEEKVLCSGLCDFTLPASFIRKSDSQFVVYDCSGYTALSELRLEKTDDFLEVLEKAISNLKKASEFLIDPAKITLSEETVYHNLKKRDVKFAYMPLQGSCVARNVSGLIGLLEEKAPEDVRRILKDIDREIREKNMSLKDMVHHVALRRRQLRKAGVC